MREAAEACGVSKDTVKRHLNAGRYPGAERGADGAWRIPLSDLLSDGLHPHAPGKGEAVQEGHAPPAPDERVARLEARVHELEAVLDERERALRIAERALAALGPAPVQTEGVQEGHAPPVAPPVAPAERGTLRRWWSRMSRS